MREHDKADVNWYDGTKYKEEGDMAYFKKEEELEDAVCGDCGMRLQKNGEGNKGWKKPTKSTPVQVCQHQVQGCLFCLCHDCFSAGVIKATEKEKGKGGQRKTGRVRKVNRKFAT